MISLNTKDDNLKLAESFEDLRKVFGIIENCAEQKFKPKTAIELDFSVSGWTAEQISAVINKICEEHEGKRDIHIKFVGTVARREDS